jgi:hypothetical protein
MKPRAVLLVWALGQAEGCISREGGRLTRSHRYTRKGRVAEAHPASVLHDSGNHVTSGVERETVATR